MTMATTFEILPAIDLRGGRVVRLRQGDFDRETAYEADPIDTARSFAAAGARWLHVVDLDGARSGEPVHGAVIAQIVAAVGEGTSVEVAGGLRTESAVDAALEAGAARAVIGTTALDDPKFAGCLVRSHGASKIAVAIDVRAGLAVGHGWGIGAPGLKAANAIDRLADVGIEIFEVTAIDRDGLLEGPEIELYERLVALDRGRIIASGGVTTLEDLLCVRTAGCTGAIVGRALYEGHLDLRDALRIATRADRFGHRAGPAA